MTTKVFLPLGFVLPCIILLASIACNTRSNRQSYLNIPCDNDNLNFVSPEDSIAVFKLTDELGIPRVSNIRNPDEQYIGFALNYLLPRVKNADNINKKIYDSVARLYLPYNYTMFNKTMYDLTVERFFTIANADAVFIGKVINITDTYDTINCKHFNLDYEVAIEEVLYSNNNIVLGDKIVIKNTWGKSAGCANDRSGFNNITRAADIRLTKKNDKRLFAINLNESARLFTLYKLSGRIPHKYKDKYCETRFIRNHFLIENSNSDTIKNVKKLLNIIHLK